jgi:ribosomal-protein-serine acetyltransferase
MFRRLVAPGIEIRHFEIGDAEAAFAVVERNRAHLREWLPWVDGSRSPEDVRAFIRHALVQTEEGRGPQAAIWIEGAIAGSVGCHPIDWANRSCSIGYWLDAGKQGQGVVTRCCAAMLDYLFGERALHRVEIRCGTGNARSCAIPERLGFEREGIAREAEWVNGRWVDLVVWAMLGRNWRARASTVSPDTLV